MYDSLTRPRIALVRQALAAAGSDFPKPVQRAIQEQDTIIAAARRYRPANVGQIHAAVAACLLEDRDPADDEHVRHMVTSNALATGTGLNVTGHAEARVVAALADHADDILDVLEPHADEAGERLAAAHELVGDENEPNVLMSRGVAVVEAWTHAQRARNLLAAIDAGWEALAHLAGFPNTGSDPALRLADLDLETLEKAGRKADAWEIVRAGGTIGLANRTTHAERVTRIAQERKDRDRDHASAAQRAWTGALKIGPR